VPNDGGFGEAPQSCEIQIVKSFGGGKILMMRVEGWWIFESFFIISQIE
jgi:hypothetical protein